MHPKTAIIIAGPTATGKTSVAIAVARHFGTEILSADSRQCYRELNIGVARPSPEQLAAAPHHFIATHSVHEKVTAAGFEAYALARAADIFARHDVMVVVGGTGLYLHAFMKGLDAIPEVSDAIRSEVLKAYEAKGLAWLQETVALHDPRFVREGEMQNPHRLLRALEVWRATGRSVLSFHSDRRKERDFRIIQLALHLPKEILHARINERVDAMMAEGLEAEARSLWPERHLNALQTVGYRELFDHFSGNGNLCTAVEAIKTHTRQYAKRQLTWFRKDPDYRWLPPDAGAVIDALK